MTYALFLLLFVIAPAALLAFALRRHLTRRYLAMIGLVIVIAVAYTTPWDNYLVASGVWRYDPALVTGILIGWVPIEEYAFFVVQVVFTALVLRGVTVIVRSPKSGVRSPDPEQIPIGITCSPQDGGLRTPDSGPRTPGPQTPGLSPLE